MGYGIERYYHFLRLIENENIKILTTRIVKKLRMYLFFQKLFAYKYTGLF